MLLARPPSKISRRPTGRIRARPCPRLYIAPCHLTACTPLLHPVPRQLQEIFAVANLRDRGMEDHMETLLGFLEEHR